MLIGDMTAPVLFASYSGLLGGAERGLLDCATRLPRPAVVACPEGALAEAAGAPGRPAAPIAAGARRLRAAPTAPATRDDDAVGALSTTAALFAAVAAARHAAGLARAAWVVGGPTPLSNE